MKRTYSATELVFLVILPALLLLLSAMYLVFTDLLRLSPYVMLCASGLMALVGCLLWGGGLCTRMIRQGAKRGMAAVCFLAALWCLLYFLSGLLAAAPYALYGLTCASLLPPMLLPAFLLRIFCGALRPSDQQQPCAGFFVLLGIGGLCALLAATDSLHHLLFPHVSGDLSYGTSLYLLYGWFFAGTLGVQGYLLVRRFSRKIIPAALVLVAEAAVFLCTLLGIQIFEPLTISYISSLLCFVFLSAALATGLLPDGREWPALLQQSTFPVQLMDTEGVILYGSEQAMPIAAGHKTAILNQRYRVSQILDRNTQLFASAIPGGFALQQKDLRDLHALQDDLDAVSKELSKTMELLSRENELEAKLQRLTKKNAFFTEQEAKIQEKTDRASLLLRCAAASSPEPGFRRTVVTRANVLVAYVQQLGRLLQVAKETDQLPVRELTAALDASAQAATAAGTRCRVYNVAQGTFPSDVILSLYDLHEQILEDVLTENLPTMEIRLRNEQSGLRLVLSVQDAVSGELAKRASSIGAMASALGGAARITEEDGTVSVFIEFATGGVHHA